MDNNSITISKKVVQKTKTVEVVGDIIVPDIKPDIINIIDTNGNAYIYKEDITQGRIRVDGNIDTYVVYLSDNGETRSMQTTISFIESIEDSSITSEMISKQRVTIESMETKILNERKITIKANLKIRSEFYEKSEIQISSELQEMQNVEKLKENLNIRSIIGMNKTKTSIKEDISVDNSVEIAEILKTNIEITNLENKITYNKVLAKADANVKVVFLAEDGRINTVESTIPVMSFIDIEKVTETNMCNVEYTIRNMLIKANSKEMHSISCQVDFEVFCEAFEVRNIEVIQDMYGIKEDIDFSKKEVEVELDGVEQEERVRLNERVFVEDIHSILDVECKPKIVNATPSGSFTNYEGEVSLDFYYEADNRNGLTVKNVRLPFIVKSEIEQTQINIEITQKKFTISNENVDCDIELGVKKENTCLKRINVIENIEKKKCEEENDYKMCVYFVKAGDTIWNIAKKFKVCMNDIIRINNLEHPEKICVGDRLYIMR